jgi:hypothetical protein
VFEKSRCQTNNAPCVISTVRAHSAVPGAKALSPPQIDRRRHLRRCPSRPSCPRSRSSPRTKAAPSASHAPQTRVTLPTDRARVSHPRSTRAWSPSDVRGRDRFDNARCYSSNPDILMFSIVEWYIRYIHTWRRRTSYPGAQNVPSVEMIRASSLTKHPSRSHHYR